MNKNGHKFNKVLWAGKNKEDGSIAFNWMYKSKEDAMETFKNEDDYIVVKVKLIEL